MGHIELSKTFPARLWAPLCATIFTALLPNGLESTLLAAEIGNQRFNWALALFAIIPSGIMALRRNSMSDSIRMALLTATIIAATAINIDTYKVTSEPLLGIICYLSAPLGIYIGKYGFETKRQANIYLMTIFGLLAAQGAIAALTTAIPSLTSFGYLAQGEDHREGFGFYRMGSTLAAANTSGCLAALCCIALTRINDNKKAKGIIACIGIVTILGYQSRSGALIITTYALLNLRTLSTKATLLMAATALIGIALLQLARDPDDADSSNAVRILYALEGIDLLQDSSTINQAVGIGPGRGITRDLTNYYGEQSSSQTYNLLSGNESFLILAVVELGIVGLSIFLITIFRLLNSDRKIFGVLMIFWLLDPSFNRCFEAFLVCSLIGIATSPGKLEIHRKD